MPNFDGTGPLKRGRIIGRGLGPCRNRTACNSCSRNPETTEDTKETGE
jgi:hypothetical protein